MIYGWPAVDSTTKIGEVLAYSVSVVFYSQIFKNSQVQNHSYHSPSFSSVVDSISFVSDSYRCPQAYYTFPVRVWTILLCQKTQAGSNWLVSWPSFGPSIPAINSQWDSGQNSDYVTPGRWYHSHEIFLDYFSGMFWIVVFLELPVAAELELLRGFLQAFIEDLDLLLLSQEFLDLDRAPCALGGKAPPNMTHAWSRCMTHNILYYICYIHIYIIYV